MMHQIIHMAAIRHKELLKEAENRHLVEQAAAAYHQASKSVVVSSADAVLDGMGRGLMALGLVRASQQKG